MGVNIERSMNRDFTTGAIDHTIRLKQGEDRGGPMDQANYYNHLIGSDTSLGLTGEFLVRDYLKGILASPRSV
jgi:hypothetical protein